MTDKRAERSPSDEIERAELAEQEAGTGAPASGGASSSPGGDMQMLIGRQLRAVYDDIAKQPVPDRFIELMKQLDTASSSR